LTPLERILATFEGRKTDRIAWQPRIDHWYDVNKALGTLPPEYRGKELLEIYDDLEPLPAHTASSPLRSRWFKAKALR